VRSRAVCVAESVAAAQNSAGREGSISVSPSARPKLILPGLYLSGILPTSYHAVQETGVYSGDTVAV